MQLSELFNDRGSDFPESIARTVARYDSLFVSSRFNWWIYID